MSQEKDPQVKKNHSVISYIAILFAAAFLLLLLSYLMQLRTSSETISGLTDSLSALQTLDDVIERNEELENEVALLRDSIEAQTNASEARETLLRQEVETLRRETEALDCLRDIQELYATGYYKKARALIQEFEAAELPQYLPRQIRYQNEDLSRLSPFLEYQQICNALF